MIKKYIGLLILSSAVFWIAPSALALANGPDAECMQDAIEQRDETLISAWDDYIYGARDEIKKRTELLKEAWDLSGKERRETIKKVWADYRATQKELQAKFKSTKKDIWIEFYSARKSCGTGAAAEDPGMEGYDSIL